MKDFKFVYNNKEYELNEKNCSYMINDEEHPVAGLEIADIIELLSHQAEIDFDSEYYDENCGDCVDTKDAKNKYFKFLEYHFYIFTKKGKYVISNISKEYQDTTYSMLLKKGIVDNSYIVSVIVCDECGSYSIEIAQCDV